MKLKNILILILCIVLCPPIVMAVSDNTVYTEFTGGNSSSTGNGTEQSPYNLFEDALNAVEDGGTICVGEKGAFVNSSDDKPLVINKCYNHFKKRYRTGDFNTQSGCGFGRKREF